MGNRILLLLADDEPLVQMAMQDGLERGGFAVLPVANGVSAMEALEENFQEIAGLITDIRLGNGPSGWVLAHRARELKASICVIYITGDSFDDWAAKGVPKSIVLQKPFADAQLVTAISHLLNEASGDA